MQGPATEELSFQAVFPEDALYRVKTPLDELARQLTSSMPPLNRATLGEARSMYDTSWREYADNDFEGPDLRRSEVPNIWRSIDLAR